MFGSSLGKREGYIARFHLNKTQPNNRKMYALHMILEYSLIIYTNILCNGENVFFFFQFA